MSRLLQSTTPRDVQTTNTATNSSMNPSIHQSCPAWRPTAAPKQPVARNVSSESANADDKSHGIATTRPGTSQKQTNKKRSLPAEKPAPLSPDRLRVRAMLAERMRKCQVNDDPRKIQCQAAALEKALYCHQQKLKGGAKTAVTFDTEDTLDRRLHQLMESLLQRRRAKISQMRDTTDPVDNHHRTAVLKQCLGAQQYQRLQSILEQVQHLGVARGCCCAASDDSSTSSSHPLQGHTRAPEAVRQLFFHTDLLRVVYRTPVEQLLQQPDWEDMLQQAERHIADYQAWLRQYDGSESCCLLVHQLCDATTGAPRGGCAKKARRGSHGENVHDCVEDKDEGDCDVDPHECCNDDDEKYSEEE